MADDSPSNVGTQPRMFNTLRGTSSSRLEERERDRELSGSRSFIKDNVKKLISHTKSSGDIMKQYSKEAPVTTQKESPANEVRPRQQTMAGPPGSPTSGGWVTSQGSDQSRIKANYNNSFFDSHARPQSVVPTPSNPFRRTMTVSPGSASPPGSPGGSLKSSGEIDLPTVIGERPTPAIVVRPVSPRKETRTTAEVLQNVSGFEIHNSTKEESSKKTLVNATYVIKINTKRGPPNFISKQINLILLNDVVIYSISLDTINEKGFYAKHMWRPSSLLFDGHDGEYANENTFSITTSDAKTYHLRAESVEEKDRWMSQLEHTRMTDMFSNSSRNRSNAARGDLTLRRKGGVSSIYSSPVSEPKKEKEKDGERKKIKKSKESDKEREEEKKLEQKRDKEEREKFPKWNGMRAMGIADQWQLGSGLLSFKRGDVINLLDCAQFEARKTETRMGGGEGVFQGYVDGQIGFVASQCIDFFRPTPRDDLDKNEYAPLLELLVSPDLALATALFTGAERSQFEYISKSIMHVFKVANEPEIAEDLIEILIKKEVALTVDPATLFRNNSSASFLMGFYCKTMIGNDYLQQTLHPLVQELSNNTLPFELDTTKLKEGQNIEENAVNLAKLTQRFLDGVLASASNCPPGVRRICRALTREVKEKFPDSMHAAVGGFVFLRYMVPALVNPEFFSIIPADVQLSADCKRLLMLVSKVMQCLGNGITEFKKEPFMAPMTGFLAQNMASVEKFFRQLADVPQKNDKRGNKKSNYRWNELEEEHSYTLHYQISFKLAKITDDLHSKQKEVLNNLIRIMDEMGSPQKYVAPTPASPRAQK